MKKFYYLSLIVLFSLIGCMALTPFKTISINQNEEKTAGIGDTFFEYMEGQEEHMLQMGIIADGYKYDLTILELNQERVGLQYNEFVYQRAYSVGYTTVPGGWVVKQGFNKRFDYAVIDKIIRFKGRECGRYKERRG